MSSYVSTTPFGLASAQRGIVQQSSLPDAKTHIWQDDAACQFADPDLFFPKGGAKANYSQAIKLCAGCPVWRQCLQFGLESDAEYGMFGGASPADRKDIKSGRIDRANFAPGHGGIGGTPGGFAREKRAGLRPCLACNDANNRAGYARKAAKAEGEA